MDNLNVTTKSRKSKHLNFKEQVTIEIRLKDGLSPYKIAKELGRSANTVRNEIARGQAIQKKQGRKMNIYFADTGAAVYEKNRKHCHRKIKRLHCYKFINYICHLMKSKQWSPDAAVGFAKQRKIFSDTNMVCTKTIYNYIDLQLLAVRNIDLPMKTKRQNKKARIRKAKRVLGTCIDERPKFVEERKVFGHWEIDTVIRQKDKKDSVILTLAERKTRNYIAFKIKAKTKDAVLNELKNIQKLYGEKFKEVFKSITCDNGQEFASLADFAQISGIDVFFTHPYSSYERGTNERHNGLLRRFIPKHKAINCYSLDDISFVEEWCNTLSRKLLGYNTPEKLFEDELNIIYAS